VKLPIPRFHRLKEIHDVVDLNTGRTVGAFMIAPDPAAGGARYSVIRLDYQTGRASCVGREVDLKFARELVKSFER
jgi:hypothetical protein